MSSRSAGESGGFEVEESADANGRIEPIIVLKASVLQRIRAVEQDKGGHTFRPRRRRGRTGNVPAGAVPALGVRRGKGRRGSQKAPQHRNRDGKRHLAHQRGQITVGAHGMQLEGRLDVVSGFIMVWERGCTGKAHFSGISPLSIKIESIGRPGRGLQVYFGRVWAQKLRTA